MMATNVTFLTVALSASRSCDQDRRPGAGAGGKATVVGHGLAAAHLFLPVIGILAFWLIGSPFVDRGRRRRQAAAGEVVSGALTGETNDLLPVGRIDVEHPRRPEPATGLAAFCRRQQGCSVRRL